MHRTLGQPGLVESWLPETLGQNARLEAISRAVDWEPFAQAVAGVYAAPEGRPSYPPLVLVKVLLLQQWYTLSDPQTEEALQDRISFRRFVGLGLADATPDYSTISRFRTALEAQELSQKLFEELQRQLEARGLLLKQGTLVDATLVGRWWTPRWWRPRCVDRPGLRGWGQAVPRTRMPPGATRAGGPGRTLGTRCILGWTRGPAWCGGGCSRRRRCMRVRWPTP